MPNPILKTAMALAFATLSALAVAADGPPARVGRVALVQGQVGIGSDFGADMSAAQVNWPVTSGTTISTRPGARTELQVGSTTIRLDGDSSLDVVELDDDSIRLRLHYGSASVRVVNPEVLRGFELLTPQARVRLQQPGRVRIDAERLRDTSAVNVFDGAALVESGGSQLTVRAGKRAEVSDDDMRTAGALQDDFDRWSSARDRLQDRAASSRYVATEMTGYEDLDRYGVWRTDSEYGPLWIPTVAASWVPYRDGSWTWIEPWGWTWVDNAPWGYAPFHYGRWVYVNRRWAWAPGSRVERVVWAPALVGWVGGSNWNITFRDRSRRPGYGWYPLSPYDRYVPSYRTSDDHLRWLNHQVRQTPRRGQDYRPNGLTVVPQDRFGPGGRVNVPKAPVATVPPAMVHNGQNLGIPATSAPPPAPPSRPHRGTPSDRADRDHERYGGAGRPERLDPRVDRNGDGRPDRFEGNRIETARADRDGFVRQRPAAQPQPQPGTVPQAGVVLQQQAPGTVPMPAPARPQPVVSPTPHQSPQPQPVVSPTPHVAPTPQPLTTNAPVFPSPAALPGTQSAPRQDRREWEETRRDRRDGRDGDEPRRERRDNEDRREHRPMQAPAPAPAPVSMAPAQPPVMAPAPQRAAPPPVVEARAEPRVERAAPPPAPMPAPVARPAPPPQQQQQQAQPSPPPRPAPPRGEERKGEERKRGDEHGRQADR